MFKFTKTKLIILVVVVIGGLFVYSIFSLLKSPSSQPLGVTSGATLAIPTPQGTVQVQDITQHPVEQVPDTTVIAKTSAYSIIYYPQEKTFSITIESQPVQQARDAAEDALLKNLGINYADACKLTVSLFVPFSVDQNLSGTNYGLSFCPNGKQF